ncbi:MAG: menaquinone biosynthesis decarboxylase, partial [Bacteroidales bacterium]|nr:menaquinone biosynthesis decarboxylase [Bacteroidales bacterium]
MNNYVKELEKAGELLRIKEFVSPELEIAEITDRVVKNSGTALLFENNGTEFPLLINVFGTYKRICQAFGVNSLDDISERIIKLFTAFSKPGKNFTDKLKLIPRLKEISGYQPKHIKGRGDCQQVLITQPDLAKLPILKCWQYDGGPFITLPNVHTKDPQTGIRNVGMYRMQVLSKDSTAMHWHLHKGSAAHFNKYKQLNQKMPVSVSLGGDPVYTYCASAPLPENIDEYLLAGFIRKQAVRLVKCITNDIYVPEDADFVLEGYIDPDEAPVLEGPFGDHTGYYSLQDYYPVFHITAITHKKQAIYPATIVGIPPQEDTFLGKATERIFLPLIKLSIAPELSDMNMPFEGVFHNLAIISIKKQYPGQGAKIINALWGAGQMMFNKIQIVTDHNINVADYNSVLNAIINNCDIDKDIFFSRG